MAKKKSTKVRSDADRRVRQCERLARLMKILQLISGRGRWDAAALAEEMDCSKRTIHRFLQTLSMAGVPWHFDINTGAYKVRPGYRFHMLDVKSTSDESEVSSSSDFEAAAEKLLTDGEAFADSLNQFLATVRQIKRM